MISIFELTVSKNSEFQHCINDIQKFLAIHKNEKLYYSYKIDGVRCLITVDKHTIPYNGGFKKIAKINYLSRNNNDFINLHHFDNDIIELCHHINRIQNIKYPIKFDCEVTGKSNNLSSVMTQLRRKYDKDENQFNLFIFDLLIDIGYSERQNILSKAFDEIKLNTKIYYNKAIPLNSNELELIQQKQKEAINQGYEGIVIFTKTGIYQYGKITNLCCKIPKINTIDLEIIGVTPGKKGTKWENKISTFICEYNNNKIEVSGRLTDRMREDFFRTPPIGKMIEISFSEITNNGILRHPRFIRFRPDKD